MHHDEVMLKKSLDELLNIFKDILNETFKDGDCTGY